MAQTGENRINFLGRLEGLMQGCLKKVTDKQAKTISAALIPMVPVMLETMQGILTDSVPTPTVKMRVLELMFSAWNRCLKADHLEKEGNRRQSRSPFKTRIRESPEGTA